MKYIEENRLEGAELKELHRTLIKTSGTVTSNLFFHQVEDVADTNEHRETLARSAYALIAVCEAIIARVPEDEARNALADVQKQFKPVDEDDVDDAIKVLLKALRLGGAMKQTIKANFKQANVNGGVATLTFEVLTSSEGAFEIIKHSGENVILGITPEQETFAFDDETGEVL